MVSIFDIQEGRHLVLIPLSSLIEFIPECKGGLTRRITRCFEYEHLQTSLISCDELILFVWVPKYSSEFVFALANFSPLLTFLWTSSRSSVTCDQMDNGD